MQQPSLSFVRTPRPRSRLAKPFSFLVSHPDVHHAHIQAGDTINFDHFNEPVDVWVAAGMAIVHGGPLFQGDSILWPHWLTGTAGLDTTLLVLPGSATRGRPWVMMRLREGVSCAWGHADEVRGLVQSAGEPLVLVEGQELGEGSFGRVSVVRAGRRPYALKIVRKQQSVPSTRRGAQLALAERVISRAMNNNSVVTCHATFQVRRSNTRSFVSITTTTVGCALGLL